MAAVRELRLEEPGGRPVLKTVEEGFAPGAGERVVDVLAAALNPHDHRIAASVRPEDCPRRLGLEAIVEMDGMLYYANRGVDPHGTVADRTMVRTATLIPLPSGLSPVPALAAGISGLAAWFALERAQIRPGESVLVLGATGAVGRTAVQLAKLGGAGYVLAVGRRQAGLAQLLSSGADATVVLDEAARRYPMLLPGGQVDVIIDMLFGDPLATALRVLRLGGRSVTVGASAGATLQLDSVVLMGRTLLSHRNSDTSNADKARAFGQLSALLTSGKLAIDSAVYSLDDAVEAWERQEQGHSGRTIVVPVLPSTRS